MPKEKIYDSTGAFDIELSWDHDAYVQLGVKMKEPQSSDSPRNLVELVQSWIDELLPKPVSTTGTTVTWTGTNTVTSNTLSTTGDLQNVPAVQDLLAQYDGLWCTLDRDGINRLVRALRRARDQAFGADA